MFSFSHISKPRTKSAGHLTKYPRTYEDFSAGVQYVMTSQNNAIKITEATKLYFPFTAIMSTLITPHY